MSVDKKRRANGEVSRQRILDAAAQIAGERGYEGTSISQVSEQSGLPVSSIYWHFRNKDELITAVIERSFARWIAGNRAPDPLPADVPPEQLVRNVMQQTGRSLSESSDFLRLGLMLALERTPEQRMSRRKFIEAREHAFGEVLTFYDIIFNHLSVEDRRALATLTLAAADGLFIASEIKEVDLTASFDLLATAVLGAAEHLARSEHTLAVGRGRSPAE